VVSSRRRAEGRDEADDDPAMHDDPGRGARRIARAGRLPKEIGS
jgi:hypothetical protein